MTASSKKIIYTIGHSTHSMETFISMLQSFEIRLLVDIRSLPGSRKYPQFNQDNLQTVLSENGIHYYYLKALTGRRKMLKNSHNDRWRNTSFRGYADYMESKEFKDAIEEIEELAEKETTAYMCAEAVWWRCHRSMVSDYLKARGWEVRHILNVGKVKEHPYTSPAIVEKNKVTYSSKHQLINT